MESKFEIAARTLYSRECEWTLGGGPVREECLLTCTHYCESLLKAWKVTMVGTDCDDTVHMSFQEGSHQKLFFQEK